MVGIRLIVIMAIVGGLIAYIADKMGSKIGKKRMSIFGLRPKHTSILLTVLSGIVISVVTIIVMAVASQSARTALFGMEKLQKELRQLNEDKIVAAEALSSAKVQVDEQNKLIDQLDEKIKESTARNDAMESRFSSMNEKYVLAQNEVQALTEAREKLSEEIDDLEKTTESLRKGIISMREGQVFYRTGEVIYAGVMYGGLTHQENVVQVNWLLQNANAAALQRLGVDPKKEQPLQAIWIANSIVDEAVAMLDNSKGNMFFRVRAVANVIVGELAVCDIEATANEFIYPDGSLIYSEDYDLTSKEISYENVIMAFLYHINQEAVKAGVLPDPMTGKVGNIDAGTMIECSNAISKTKGKFTINAFADGDITTAGPVRVRMEVIPRDDD